MERIPKGKYTKGVAEEMKKVFGEKLNLAIHRTDSDEAMKYDFKISTNVIFEGELISLDISLDKQKMMNFLTDRFS